MADKVFNLKVLIPTDDGFNISEQGIEKSKYYLLYNISNRSYQLAGKIKTKELYELGNLSFTKLRELALNENLDLILSKKAVKTDIGIPLDIIVEDRINEILNSYIDIIDKKSAN